nr:hypothetical protein [Mycoplasmopsis bovis]
MTENKDTNWLKKFDFDAFLDADFKKENYLMLITDWQVLFIKKGSFQLVHS